MIKHIVSYIDKSLMKFLAVGGASTAIDYTIYTSLYLWFPPTHAKIISMLCATLFSFILNRNWTFQNKEQSFLKALGKYYLAQSANITTNVLVNTLLLRILNKRLLSFLFATGAAMCVNYFLQKTFVFKKEMSEESK